MTRILGLDLGEKRIGIAVADADGIAMPLTTLRRATTLEVVSRPGIGVDRTLIRETLALVPEERVLAAGRAGRALAAWNREVDGARHG